MIQFYAPDLATAGVLASEEVLHCVKVLRKRTGDIIYTTDGKGRRFECRIVNADTRSVELEIISSEEVKKNWQNNIVLAVVPTKNAERMAWLVEKAVEIGVDEIVFVSSKYSERKNLNVDRLRRNAISAMNQSLKTYLPLISELIPLKEFDPKTPQKFVGYCNPEIERFDYGQKYKPNTDVTILIGPEGDFSTEEISRLINNGFIPVTFGLERLRTETAAFYGLTATHVLNNIF